MFHGRAVYVAICGIALGGLVALNAYVLFPLKEQTVERELSLVGSTIENVARLTESRLIAAELQLDNAVRELNSDRVSAEQAHVLLKTFADAVPHIRVIGIVDVAGDVIFSSRARTPPPVNLSDRDYVSFWQNGGTGERFLSGPILNAVDKRWQVSLSKPMMRDGKLAGVIGAVINVDGLGVSVHAGPDDADYLTLTDKSFRLIDHHPARPEDVGRSLARSELYQALAASENGMARGIFVHPLTGETRLAAARMFFGDSLVISSSRPLSLVLRTWRHLAIVNFCASALLCLIALGVMVLIRRDIRLRREHAASLQELNGELKQRTAEAERLAQVKADFLATMSHEIRTPLTAIMGMLDLCRQSRNVADIKRHLTVAEGASRVLLGIINDILDSERLESGRLSLESIPFSLRALAEQALASVRFMAEDKGLELQVDLPAGDLPALLGDQMRLSQILVNLLSNAIKFTDTGRVGLAMRLTSAADRRFVLRVDVTDTGAGIPQEKIDLLFRPFEQLSTWRARRSGGSGLGLSICKRLVDAMNGRIGVITRLDLGSRFWFEVELDEADGGVAAESAQSPEAPLATALQVLVVDDNVINRDLIREMLTFRGFRVQAVDSGKAAIERMRDQRFDVVLLDIQMPDMDGVDTIRELKRMRLVESTAVIALTANAMEKQVAEYVREGFDSHATKPIDWSDLLEKIGMAAAARAQPARPGPRSTLDVSAVEEVMRVLGRDRASSMLREAIESARVMVGGLSDVTSEAALDEAIHAMSGFLGNLGIATVPEMLKDFRVRRPRPGMMEMRSSLLAALRQVSEEVDDRYPLNEVRKAG